MTPLPMMTPKQEDKLHPVAKPRKMITEMSFEGDARGTSLSLAATKVLNMLFSVINTMDIPEHQEHLRVAFPYRDYWLAKGVTDLSGKHTTLILDALREIRRREVQINLMDSETGKYKRIYDSWITRIEEEGTVEKEHPDYINVLMPTDLLLQMRLDQDVLKVPLEYSIGITSAYAYTAREAFLAWDIYDTPIRLSVEELAALVDAPQYSQFAFFRINVVEQIVKGINTQAKDISVQVEYEKTGRKFTHVIFTVHKTFPDISTHVVDTEMEIDVELLEAIRHRIGYEELRIIYGTVADTVSRILLSSYTQLDTDGDLFASKLGMTAAELKYRLDSLTQEEVVLGLDSLRSGSMEEERNEILVLDSILNASNRTGRKSYGAKKTADMPSRTNAKKEIQSLIHYDFLSKITFSPNITGSDLPLQALDDLVAAMVTILVTTTPYVQISKNCSIAADTARQEIREHLNEDTVIRVLERYLANYDSIRCVDSVKGRRNYLKACVFNEMQDPSEDTAEEDEL